MYVWTFRRISLRKRKGERSFPLSSRERRLNNRNKKGSAVVVSRDVNSSCVATFCFTLMRIRGDEPVEIKENAIPRIGRGGGHFASAVHNSRSPVFHATRSMPVVHFHLSCQLSDIYPITRLCEEKTR